MRNGGSARSSMDERGSPNGSTSEASQSTDAPQRTRTLLGSVNATLHWAVDWTKVIAVHGAAYLVRGGAENERKTPR